MPDPWVQYMNVYMNVAHRVATIGAEQCMHAVAQACVLTKALVRYMHHDTHYDTLTSV